jgi:hypothetical protein
VARGKAYKASDSDRAAVEKMCVAGITRETMSRVMEISEPTLLKHYKKELETSSVKANTNIAGKLYEKAINGDTTALIFWCKTQLGWRETTGLVIERQDITDEPMTEKEWFAEYGHDLAPTNGASKSTH